MHHDKQVLIIDGVNGCGKDVFINLLLEHCPYYKVHYAGSAVLREFQELDKFDYSKIGLVTFETLYSSIEKDTTSYPHIQYRSLVTNYIYNALFRFDSEVQQLDYDYMMRFFYNKYKDNYTLWLSTYSDDYLNSVTSDELSSRLRSRSTEIQKVRNINNEYRRVFEMLSKDTNIRCDVVHTDGVGCLDILKPINESIKDMTAQPYGSKLCVVSDNFNDDSPSLTNLSTLNVYVEQSLGWKCIGSVQNPNPKLIFDDFFQLYVVHELQKRASVEPFLSTAYSTHLQLTEETSDAQRRLDRLLRIERIQASAPKTKPALK